MKYIIRKDTPDGFGGNNSETKTIKKSKYKLYKNDGWYVLKKKIFIITQFSDWWRSLNTNQKISIIGIIIASITALIIDNTGCN
jgi:hypothetical protein